MCGGGGVGCEKGESDDRAFTGGGDAPDEGGGFGDGGGSGFGDGGGSGFGDDGGGGFGDGGGDGGGGESGGISGGGGGGGGGGGNGGGGEGGGISGGGSGGPITVVVVVMCDAEMLSEEARFDGASAVLNDDDVELAADDDAEPVLTTVTCAATASTCTAGGATVTFSAVLIALVSTAGAPRLPVSVALRLSITLNVVFVCSARPRANPLPTTSNRRRSASCTRHFSSGLTPQTFSSSAALYCAFVTPAGMVAATIELFSIVTATSTAASSLASLSLTLEAAEVSELKSVGSGMEVAVVTSKATTEVVA